jgi:sialic acid synthase SpsE
MGKILESLSRVFVIAEIGINHNGSFERAKQLVDDAVDAGADCAKFQIRNLETLYGAEDGGGANGLDLGVEYTLDILTRFQLSTVEYEALFDYCRTSNILPMCTPWDVASVEFLETQNLPIYKVASADLTNDVLLQCLSQTGRELIISTGMATESDVDHLVEFLEARKVDYALLHCNSTYPAPFHGINLNYLKRLREKVPGRVVGYSGHERGFEVPIAAVALGAKIIEKHLTRDRNLEGNDHKVSLLPHEFSEMVRAIRNVEEAMGTNGPRSLSVGEMMNRENLAKSLVAARDLEKGQVIAETDISIKSPGNGLQPNRSIDLLGLKLGRSMKRGDVFFPSDISGQKHRFRKYSFSRKYGIPVRFHDCDSLVRLADVDFVEFHLSYKDVDGFPKNCRLAKHEIPFLVHTPDLFSGDHLIDFASFDDDYRDRSINEIQRVIDLARGPLAKFFRNDGPVKIVASLGGFTRDDFVDDATQKKMYARVSESIRKLDRTGVELLPQTLPPFPWYLGGQLHCNLFVTADDSVEFAKEEDLRICLDISHSKLACNFYGKDFMGFLENIVPHVGHLHIVDAASIDSEGLQIGEGDVDFSAVFDLLDRKKNSAWFIPEIWQGHKDEGAGFWEALRRLEKILERH